MKITLSEIATLVNGTLKGNGKKEIYGVNSFEDADNTHITFASNAKYFKRIDTCRAAAVIVPPGIHSPKDIIIVDNPELAFIEMLNLFHPSPKPVAHISNTNHIGKDFICGADVSIGNHVSIADHVRIGDRVTIFPGVYIGDDVTIGNDVIIHPNVTIYHNCRIGSRIIIHAGTVIGSDGFGFFDDKKKYHKIPQVGIVQIDDDVEIGAVNTIDRATLGKTWIKSGTKTDNLIHIAHNVTIGENSVIAAQTGVAGSTTIGSRAILAGQAGISDHISIGDNVIVGPKSGVTSNLKSNQIVSGNPEMPHKIWLKVNRILPRLPELRRIITQMDKRLRSIEANSKKAKDE